MPTDADSLAKTFGGITLRSVIMTVIACCTTIAAIGAGFAGWTQLGGPVPASRSFVVEHIQDVADSLEELGTFAKGTRAIVVQQQYTNALESIVSLEEKIDSGKGTRETRLLLQSKRSLAEQYKRQLDRLEAHLKP